MDLQPLVKLGPKSNVCTSECLIIEWKDLTGFENLEYFLASYVDVKSMNMDRLSLAKLCNEFCYSYIYVDKLNQLTYETVT